MEDPGSENRAAAQQISSMLSSIANQLMDRRVESKIKDFMGEQQAYSGQQSQAQPFGPNKPDTAAVNAPQVPKPTSLLSRFSPDELFYLRKNNPQVIQAGTVLDAQADIEKGNNAGAIQKFLLGGWNPDQALGLVTQISGKKVADDYSGKILQAQSIPAIKAIVNAFQRQDPNIVQAGEARIQQAAQQRYMYLLGPQLRPLQSREEANDLLLSSGLNPSEAKTFEPFLASKDTKANILAEGKAKEADRKQAMADSAQKFINQVNDAINRAPTAKEAISAREKLIEAAPESLQEIIRKETNQALTNAKFLETQKRAALPLDPEKSKKVAQLVVNGQMAPSQIKAGWGGKAWAQITSDIYDLDPDFNEITADANYAWYKNPTTQKVLRRTDTLLQPGGSLDLAIKAAANVANPAAVPINRITGLAKTQISDANRIILSTINTLTADEVGQLLGSTQGGEYFIKLGQQMMDPNVSAETYAKNANAIRQMLLARYKSFAMGTPLEKQMKKYEKAYGTIDQPENNSGPQGNGSSGPKILSIEPVK